MVSMAIVLAVVTILGAALATFISVGSRVRAGQGIGASFRSILVAYFYVMSVVSLVVFSIGMTSLVKVGLGGAFGPGFSYSVPLLVKPMALPSPVGAAEVSPTTEQDPAAQQQQVAQTEQERRSNLVQGWSLAIAGGLVWALHTWGRRRIVRSDDALSSFMARTHLVVLLLLFGLGGLISLVMGIYQSLLFTLTPVNSFTYRQPPGETAAMALIFVPLWVVILGLALRELRRERG